jgi:vacuolar-type H+-ATPase subunit H
MEAEAAINIPAWAQQVTVFGVMICSVIIGIWKYFKTEAEKVVNKAPAASETIVTAASFVDTKILRELIDTLREHQEEMGRQSQRVTRSQQELRETIIESTEALHVQTNATLNMLRFLNRQEALK